MRGNSTSQNAQLPCGLRSRIREATSCALESASIILQRLQHAKNHCGLVHTEPDKADAFDTHLSELLRPTLRASSETFVSLAHEAEFLTCYFNILEVRFNGRISYKLDLTPAARMALVPRLLQPLVENAVRHKLEPGERGRSGYG